MRRLLVVLLLVPLFLGRAYAEDLDAQTLEIFGAGAMEQGLREEETEISGRPALGSYDAGSALKRLWHYFMGRLREELRTSLGPAAELMGLLFFCAFAVSLCAEERIRGVIEICGACAEAALLTGNMDSLVSQITQAMYRLSDYSKAALPVVYTAAAAGGAPSSSAVRYAAASLALDVMMSLSQKAVIPLIYAALALTLSNVVFPNAILGAAEKLAAWAAKTVMRGAAMAFTAYLGMSSLISTSVDAAAVKAARSVISGALPVVGGILSDASAAVLSAAAVVRSCTGVFGLIAVSAMCAGPFALLTVKCLLFKAIAAAAESVQSPRMQKLFAGVGSAVGMLTGLLGCYAVMLFLSFTAAMKAVTA